jgi:hypothetical protein
MVRLSLTFGELGEIFGRVVCTRGSSLISPVMFTLYSTTGTFTECDKVCMHLCVKAIPRVMYSFHGYRDTE